MYICSWQVVWYLLVQSCDCISQTTDNNPLICRGLRNSTIGVNGGSLNEDLGASVTVVNIFYI